MPIVSSFNAGLQGWTSAFSTLSNVADGWSGNGIRVTDTSSGSSPVLNAPAAFRGDLSSYFDGTLSFWLKLGATANRTSGPDIVIQGGTGPLQTITLDFPLVPGTGWTRYEVSLNENADWRDLNGNRVSEAVIRNILSNVTSLALNADYRTGAGDTATFDEIRLDEGFRPSTANAAFVSSFFSNGSEGWTVVGDVEALEHRPTGGNGGGYFYYDDYATGATCYYVAPDKFLDNKSGFYGGELSFSLLSSGPSPQFFGNEQVILRGANGMQISYQLGNPPPAGTWTSYTVNLTQAGWRKPGNQTVTEAEFRAILADLDEMRIIGEFRFGDETGGIDSVTMSVGNPLAQPILVYEDSALGPVKAATSSLFDALGLADRDDHVVMSTLSTAGPGWFTISGRGSFYTGTIWHDNLTIEVPNGARLILDLQPEVRQITLAGTYAATVYGNDRANVLTGNAGNNVLHGYGGNDIFRPGRGTDTMFGGEGSDTVSYMGATQGVIVNLAQGTAQNSGRTDILTSIENVNGTAHGDFLIGDQNANLLRGLGGDDFLFGSPGGDTLDGGAGIDRVDYTASQFGVTVNLTTGRGTSGDATGDRYISIEAVRGSSVGDTFTGSAGADRFEGMGGRDLFIDTAGRDTYDGGAGIDTVSYANSTVGVSVNLTTGRGGPQLDVLLSIENVFGSSQDDVLRGNAARNTLTGSFGDDRLFGEGGDDLLTGGAGNDVLNGGGGTDTAYFSGNRADYAVTVGATGVITVRHLGGGLGGTDRLVDVELVQFDDQILSFL